MNLCKTRKHTLLNFGFHAVEHCNLNCINCTHFSPVACKGFYDVNKFEKDLLRLSELFDSEVGQIEIAGGEPLLHPEINTIMRIARETFKYGEIIMITNGTMLENMNDDFWNTLSKYEITLTPTRYPINIDYEKARILASDYKVRYKEWANRDTGGMCRFVLDPEGNYNPESNFDMCPWANLCITLKDGRLYTCQYAAYASHLKKYFKIDFSQSQRNGIDIYTAKSCDEIMEFLSNPIPFCRYCNITSSNNYGDVWQKSNKDVYEWVEFTFSSFDLNWLHSKASDVYIFGAGKWAKKALDILWHGGVTVTAALVTDSKMNPTEIGSIKVMELDAIDVKHGDIVIICVSENKTDIAKRLHQRGFKHIIPIFNEPKLSSGFYQIYGGWQP